MRIVCYGDSNTYGFDPRSFIGGRYPASSRWPDLVAETTGHEVINEGMNGRMIPTREAELNWMHEMIEKDNPDFVIVMLGINDLLCGASVGEIVQRMDRCLDYMPDFPTLLIGPPPIQRGEWVPNDQLLHDASQLSDEYGELAARRGIRFAETKDWGVEVTFDGVHFTEEGHKAFARGICGTLRDECGIKDAEV